MIHTIFPAWIKRKVGNTKILYPAGNPVKEEANIEKKNI